jgi:hypothetical protein
MEDPRVNNTGSRMSVACRARFLDLEAISLGSLGSTILETRLRLINGNRFSKMSIPPARNAAINDQAYKTGSETSRSSKNGDSKKCHELWDINGRTKQPTVLEGLQAFTH